MMWLMKTFSKGSRNKAGFTLVELMIVVIVVGILAAASIPIYQRSMDKARASEGKAILGTARTHYITELAGGTAPVAGSTGGDTLGDWGIDTSNNKWWQIEVTDFTVDWTGYPAIVQITGVTAPITGIVLAIDCATGDFTTETYP